MGEGEFALVRQHLEIALSQTGEWVGDHDMYATLVDTAALEGNAAAIREYAPQAEALAHALNHALYEGIIHRAWGVAHRLAGEYDSAQMRLDRSLEIFNALGTRWQRGRTLFELGELAATDSRSTDARAYFAGALEDFEFMRAAPSIARTRAAIVVLEQPAI